MSWRAAVARLVFNVRVLRITGQVAAIGLLVVLALYLRDNYSANIREQGARTGWGFLDGQAGFDIDTHPDFRRTQPVRDALWAGVQNTASAAFLGMIITTVLGVVIGVIRLSRSWLARQAATLYVEVLRNIPVLLIILFTNAWIQTLPRVDRPGDRATVISGLGFLSEGDIPLLSSLASRLDHLMVVSNRQIAVLWPVSGDNLGLYGLLLAAALVAAFVVGLWRTRVSEATGQPHHRLLWGGGLFLVVAIGGYYALSRPVGWSRPVQAGREILGGASLTSAFIALTFALALYHASHIAEIVRGSILAVPHGQTEAATALGLSDFQRLRFVVLPQAFRIAVPPTINQLLSLTKNTSLGIAVAYSDLFNLAHRLVGSNRAPALQTMAILMALYLMFSMAISLLLNILNRRLQLVER